MKALKIGDIVLHNDLPHLVSGIVGRDGQALVELHRLTRLPDLVPLAHIEQADVYDKTEIETVLEQLPRLLRELGSHLAILRMFEAMGQPLDRFSQSAHTYCDDLSQLAGVTLGDHAMPILERLQACRAFLTSVDAGDSVSV